MQVGKVQALPVAVEGEEITLLVKMSYGDLKNLMRKTRELKPTEDPTAPLVFAEETMLRIVIGVRGLTGEDGEEITKLTPEVLAAMSPMQFMACWQAVTNPGEAVPTPPSASAP